MDDTLNDGDNDGSELEHGNVEDNYEKTFYTMNRGRPICEFWTVAFSFFYHHFSHTQDFSSDFFLTILFHIFSPY